MTPDNLILIGKILFFIGIGLLLIDMVIWYSLITAVLL